MSPLARYLLAHIHRTQHKGMDAEGCVICARLLAAAEAS